MKIQNVLKKIFFSKFLKMDENKGRMLVSPGKLIGKRYRVVKELGDGAFSNVYKCIDLLKNFPVVIKCFRSMQDYSTCALSEAAVMSALNNVDKENKHFIKYYGRFDYHGHVCIVVQEFGISLFDALKARKFIPYSTATIRAIMYKLVEGLQILHKTGLIHTDIKLENILLPPNFDLNLADENNANNTNIGHQSDPSSDDFISKRYSNSNISTGISIDLSNMSNKNHFIESADQKLDLNQIDVRLIDFSSLQSSGTWHDNLATTRRYRAPEIMMGLKWGSECDIWSLGCILVELATGDIIFDAKDDCLHLFLIQHTIEPFPDWMCKECTINTIREKFCWSSPINLMKPNKEWSEEMKKPTLYEILKFDPDLADLALKMLRTNPFDRISINDVLNHPFFTDIK